ncbi:MULTISPECIES: MAST domain-containing protein [unclassified Methanosarcina]|uniref:MAST domain-containing protein n=1 Tax=unclassified Methanosarcina TaxID=2644672 RepID=UPI0012E0495F|nr:MULTISPECIES: MAST domain-containing protein [unclassified Methanosarcina]
MKSLELSVFFVLFIVILGASPALAQMGQGGGPINGMGQGMNQGMNQGISQEMMNGYGFDQYDNRFEGFGSMTFQEVCSNFGIPVKTALSDLGLPEDMSTQLTILEVEEQYGVSGQEIVSYMVMNTKQAQTSLNARQRLLMGQQAVQAVRGGGMGRGMYFMRQGRFAYGNYTTFNFDSDAGEVSNFAVSGDMIFDSVTVSDFAFKEEQVAGTTAVYESADSQILLHDNPMGTMQVMAFADKTIVFDLADEVEASMDTTLSDDLKDVIVVKITKNNFEGYLTVFKNYLASGTDAEPLEGLDVKVSDDRVTVTLVENSVVMFRAIPMEPAFMQTGYNYGSRAVYMHQVLNREIANGRVGAELAIRAGGDNASIVNYTPMGLQVMERDRDRIVLGVDSDLPEGRVITVNVDNETINLSNPDRLRLRFDGVEIEKAESIDELFVGGNRPLCYLVQENETATMAVYIPKFSEHEIVIDLEPEAGEEGAGEEVEEEGVTEEGSEAESTPAFEFGLGVAVLASAYGLKRRR